MRRSKNKAAVSAETSCRQLGDLRIRFWEALRSKDWGQAESLQNLIRDFPTRIPEDFYDQPAVSDAWSEARSDTDLDVGTVKKSGVTPLVWEAKAHIERLKADLGAQRTASGDSPGSLPGEVLQLEHILRGYFSGLPVALRQHPILRHAMSTGKERLRLLTSESLPPLSPTEREELKRRRIRRWTEDLRSVIVMAELLCKLEVSEDGLGGDGEHLSENRVAELVQAGGGRVISVYWTLEDHQSTMLVLYAVEYEEDTAHVTEQLVASDFFSVLGTRRLFTSGDLRFASLPPFPFADGFREDDLDEEELEAFREGQRRMTERDREILAITPCCVCGRIVAPDEAHNLDFVGEGSVLEDDDGTIIATGPAAIVYCSMHRN